MSTIEKALGGRDDKDGKAKGSQGASNTLEKAMAQAKAQAPEKP